MKTPAFQLELCWSVMILLVSYALVVVFTSNHLLATIVGVSFYLFGVDLGKYLWATLKSFI